MAQKKSAPLTTTTSGYAADGFESVMDSFRQGFSQGVDKGSSFSIVYQGSVVVSACGGLVDENPKRPWEEETMGYFFSGSKFLTSIVVASLVEKGLLDYEEKISKYWPEFSQNGKEGITLKMLMSHTAGLSMLNENYELGWMKDKPNLMKELLEKQKPLWEPGTQVGYSPICLGLYMNEIVKRVDGKGRIVSEYFHDEVALPLGLSIHIGLPKTLYHRSPRLFWPTYSKEEIDQLMAGFQGDWDLYKKSLHQPSDWDSRYKINDPEFASLPCPSTHAISTSLDMARLAYIISSGGQYEDKSVLKQTSIDNLQKPVAYEMDSIAGAMQTFGLGTMMIFVRQGDKTWNIFGHPGFGGQAVYCDPVKKFGFAYCTNYANAFSSFEDNKWRHLLEALYLCIQRMEGGSEKVRLFGTYQEYLQDLKDNPINSKL